MGLQVGQERYRSNPARFAFWRRALISVPRTKANLHGWQQCLAAAGDKRNELIGGLAQSFADP